MSFWRYVFRFLYVRNWHTGRWELSTSRLYWFVAAVSVAAILLAIIAVTQITVVYESV